MSTKQYSISPSGERFPLPSPADYKAEFARLKKLATSQRGHIQRIKESVRKRNA